MQARQSISLFLLSLTMALANAAWAAYPEYRVTVVGPRNSFASDINNAGAVAGFVPRSPGSDAYRAFVNRGKGIVYLDKRGATSSLAVAINDKGVVLGNWTDASGTQRGFLYCHGSLRDIGGIGSGSTNYTDINNAGYVTAIATVTPFGMQRGFLRAPNGTLRDIGSFPVENPVTLPYALNNRNQITGQSGPFDTPPDLPLRAFLWTKGVMRDLGDFGAVPVSGDAINDRGQVAGSAELPFNIHNKAAFLYSHGRLIKLDDRPNDVEQFTTASGINNRAHIVGTSDRLSGYIYRGRRMESLNALIDPRLGWDIRFPQAINDAGQIAATAERGGVLYAVRLDLIRKSAESAPQIDENDHEAGPIVQPLSQQEAAADARAEAEAQARELAQPVRQ
jgi:probable HAF family extracellular repeat protein